MGRFIMTRYDGLFFMFLPFTIQSLTPCLFVSFFHQCLAHQNNRSAKFSAGTGDFKVCSNPELRAVLMKAHNIIARVHRSPYRIKVVRDVQKARKRLKDVLPVPSVVTRWDSSNAEVASLNRIMWDFNTALGLLLDDFDKGLLVSLDDDEEEPVDRSDFCFTAEDKSILCQFECGSESCLKLSKFYQLNKATVHETLFVTLARLAEMSEPSFTMFGDISHSELPDLTKRVKSVVVISSAYPLGGNGGANEVPMEECIETFRSLYVEDMSKRCGIRTDDDRPVVRLPHVLGLACLLNPMYGGTLLFRFVSFCFVQCGSKQTNNCLCHLQSQVKQTS
jgi:hypothetical protein